MSDSRQLPLDFAPRPAMGDEDFLVADCNREAVAWLDRWPDWPGPALLVYGPPRCGKTHLSRVFAARSGARLATLEDLAAQEPPELLGAATACVLDDAEGAVAAGLETPLLHLFNSLRDLGGHLLLTAAQPPQRWGIGLPDLASRLNAAAAVAIRPPDEGLLAAVLVKLFADRQLRIDAGVIPFVLARMERSFEAADRLVAAADQAALAERRKITVPLMRKVMDVGSA